MPKPSKRFSLCTEVRALSDRRGEVRITSDISRWKWDDDSVTSNDFHKKLDALGDVDEITVRINSPGGVVTEAIAIRSELMRHKAKKIIEIEGLCASAATLIACLPGATVRMVKGSEYMIHRCIYGAYGHADDMLAAYNSMMVTDENMADIYAERTGKTKEDCLALMTSETWMKAQDAVDEGFVDEVVTPDEDELDMVACAVDRETMALMKECYARIPDQDIREEETAPGEEPETDADSNGSSAVAADGPSVNNHEGVNSMDELRNATAEQLQAENPALAQSITNDAISAERNRIKRINSLTRKGAKWEAMAKKAIEDGTSVEDFLTAVIAEEEKDKASYLENRQRETQQANNVGGGDSGDHDDDVTAKVDKAASDIASLMKDMNADGAAMA